VASEQPRGDQLRLYIMAAITCGARTGSAAAARPWRAGASLRIALKIKGRRFGAAPDA
jgi:hypothetical protein